MALGSQAPQNGVARLIRPVGAGPCMRPELVSDALYRDAGTRADPLISRPRQAMTHDPIA